MNKQRRHVMVNDSFLDEMSGGKPEDDKLPAKKKSHRKAKTKKPVQRETVLVELTFDQPYRYRESRVPRYLQWSAIHPILCGGFNPR